MGKECLTQQANQNFRHKCIQKLAVVGKN